MNFSITQKITAILTTIAILLPLTGGGVASMAFAEKAELSTGNSIYNKVVAPVLKPAWSSPVAILDKGPTGRQVTALAENGKVFVLQKSNKLAALNASSGQKLWEFGNALAPLFTYSNGNLYGLTKSGSLYAISEAGKQIWSTALSFPHADSIEHIGSTLYVTQAEQLAAVDAVTGKIKWKISENSNIYIGLADVMETEGVLIRDYISEGAISLAEIVAYDAKTGKKLWEKYRQSMPLAIKNGLLYSITATEMSDDDPVNRKIKVSVFNLKSGELKGERQYKWTDTESPGGNRSGGAYGSAFLDGNNFYVFQGKMLAKYDFWNYTEEGKPVQEWQQTLNKEDFPLNKVLQERMFYTDYATGAIWAIKLAKGANGQIVRFNQGENPTVQTDIFGSVVYTGQSDGLFHAYDMLSLKPIFTVNTGSREFGPSLKAGAMLIIQTGGKLLGIKLPASIKP